MVLLQPYFMYPVIHNSCKTILTFFSKQFNYSKIFFFKKILVFTEIKVQLRKVRNNFLNNISLLLKPRAFNVLWEAEKRGIKIFLKNKRI